MEATSGPIRFGVGEADEGATLHDLVARVLGDPVETARVFAHGGVWIGRERVLDGARTVASGDAITISRPPSGQYATVEIDPAWILYEDSDLIALDKPPGVYVEATPWDLGGNLRVALEQFLAERDGAAHPHLAHRLDRDTSGVLLFGKNPAVNPALQRCFAGGAAHKTYLCRCAGEPEQDVFELTTGHGRGANGKFRIYPAETIGQTLPAGGSVKRMTTRFEVVRREGDSSLVQAEPITGRTHQIRLHLAHLGHPLLGDGKYGGPTEWRGRPLPYHLLQAARLELPHPRTAEPLSIRAHDVWWASPYQPVNH